MATGSTKTRNGKKIMLYRANTENTDLSTTEYLAETQFNVGINNGTPNENSTDLDNKIPIGNGTINDDGSNTLTGTSGGTNTTDNTIIYKEGAGTSDNTAQNLLSNSSSVTKTWTISNLATNGVVMDSNKYTSLWLYVKDSVTLAKFSSSGTSFQVKLRTNGDGATLFYSLEYDTSDLSTGWNWITNGNILSSWDQGAGGAPSGTINELVIEITTNLAADIFLESEVVYDLLRQWNNSEFYKDFQAGYPSLNLTDLEVTQRGYLNSLEANGFDLNGVGTVNEDASRLLGGETTHNGISKSRTDEIAYIIVDRIL